MHGFVYALALRSSKTFQKKGANKYRRLIKCSQKKKNDGMGTPPKRGRKRKG